MLSVKCCGIDRGVTHVTHMKNCEPFVSFPRLAMDNRKALSCLRMKFSSVRSRERGVEVLQCILLHATIVIFRDDWDKREKSLFPPNHCLFSHSFNKCTFCSMFQRIALVISMYFYSVERDYPSIKLLHIEAAFSARG